MTECPCEKGLSCGRSKYFKPFQLLCVPRKMLISNSTSRPSSANKPSCMATKSFNPMPFGATETLIAMKRLHRPDKVMTFVQLVVYCTTPGRQAEYRKSGRYETFPTAEEAAGKPRHRSFGRRAANAGNSSRSHPRPQDHSARRAV